MPASLFEKIWLFRMMPFPLPRTTMPERRPWWIWLHCKWTWDTTEDRSDMPERSRVLNHLPTAAPGWTQWRKQHPRKIPSTRRSAWTLLLPCPSCTGAHLGTYQGESEGRSVHCPASWDIVASSYCWGLLFFTGKACSWKQTESPKSPPNTQSSGKAMPARVWGAYLSGKGRTPVHKNVGQMQSQGGHIQGRVRAVWLLVLTPYSGEGKETVWLWGA